MSLFDWILGSQGTGARIDPMDHRDWDFPRLGLSRAFTGAVDLRDPSCPVRNQRATSSCVGMSAAVVLQLAYLKGNRVPCAPISALDIYYSARELEGDKIDDLGAYPRLAWKAIVDHGAAPEDAWAFSTLRVNRRPSWAARREGYERRGARAYATCRTLDEIELALQCARPVQASWTVRESFMSVRTHNVLGAMTGQKVGGHAMAIVGVERYDNERVWTIQNSWGTGWGNQGFARVSDFFMIESRDRRSIDV